MSNDVLFPRLYEIDGRVYCDYNHTDQFQQYDDHRPQSNDLYREEEDDDWLREDDVINETDQCEDFEISKHPNGGFVVRLQIPSVLHCFMIGTKHSVRKQMESETGARIQYPHRESPNSTVVVTSQQKRSVISCSNRLYMMSLDCRWRVPFTHFVSIKLSFDHVIDSFEKFRDDILSNRKMAAKIDECLFQTPSKLHLTICTLHLLDDEEVKKGKRVLQNFPFDDILRGSRLEVDIRGLEVMNDDPSDVDVLYAKVECEDGKLQRLANGITESFIESNLSEKKMDGRDVKLHATLINSKFRPGLDNVQPTRGKSYQKKTRYAFDASHIFQSPRLTNFNFGKVTIDEILISSRTDYTDGYYTTIDKLHLTN